MKKAIQRLIVGLVLGFVLAGCDMPEDNAEDNDARDAAAGTDGDTDSDAGTDAGNDTDAGGDSGTDAGEESCEEYIDDYGNCAERLECYCEYEPEECEDTIEKARERAENDEDDESSPIYDPWIVCLVKCTDGGGYITETDRTHEEIHYYSPSTGRCRGVYMVTDIPSYCGGTCWEKHVGDTSGCEAECQVGVDCDTSFPQCD